MMRHRGQGEDSMNDYEEELDMIFKNSKEEDRDKALFELVDECVKDDAETALKAAASIKDYYTRGWALLKCVQSLVRIDLDRAQDIAGMIEDDYNRYRARNMIEFAKVRQPGGNGFDPRMN